MTRDDRGLAPVGTAGPNNRVELRQVSARPLRRIELVLEPGVHVALGQARDGTRELLELCCGVRAPERGRVWVNGRSPHESPHCRARIGSLLEVEPSPRGSTVGSFLEELTALHGNGSASRVHDRLALPQDQALAALRPGETRALALVAALTHPDPALLALHEPWDVAGGLDESWVRARLEELAERTVVLIATQSVATARSIGGSLHILERGVVSRKPTDGWPDSLTPGLGVRLAVDCSAPQELLKELAGSASVGAVHFDAASASRRLTVEGRKAELLAEAVARAALAARVEIERLELQPVDVEVVHAATAGLANAAYESARTAGRAGRTDTFPNNPGRMASSSNPRRGPGAER